MGQQRPTLETVARAADVSRQTVSNVLHAPHLVRPATRERVEAVIAQTGYRPVKAAQTLRTRRSHLIAMGIPNPGEGGGELLDRFLHALTEQAQQRGYRILLFTAGDDTAEIASYDSLLSEYDLDAFVLTSTHTADSRTAWLTRHRVPFVTFGRPWGGVARHSWVDVDGACGVTAATEHLIGAGHQRIAFLGWPEGSGAGDDRRAGWEQACQAAGLPVSGLSSQVEEGLAPGRQACAALLDSARPPTAFMCVSDSIALGAWTELTARGLVPGTDAAVIGFDDSAAAAVIGLTSLAQPVAAVAGACLDALQKLLASSGGRPRHDRLLLEPRLVLRSSA
ncbi:MAG TPA: LacI family DNA-binding transcriptional regulator [Streptosporangiaceae bacterium]|nr:LacI family DNA-binding transcriptional regulator [Streptosporangiaceae bacterium]